MNPTLFDSDVADIMKGYHSDHNNLTCLICQQQYEIGQIYPCMDQFFDANKRMKLHIEEEHGGMLSYLLHCNPDLLGISELQQEMLQLFTLQLSDKEIAKRQGIALSTIRNYRYKLREKEKQARMFLAAMNLLELQSQRPVKAVDGEMLVDAPVTANILDQRFNITESEKEKFTKQYFDENGHLREYPSKAKRKVIVLQVIANLFKKDISYTEVEVNRILKRIYDDYVTIRRALIEYGFMDRNDDCSKYWMNQ